MVDPITKGHAGRVNVSSVVARFQQLAEFRSRLGPRAAERHRIALLADAISGCRSPSIAGSCAMPSAAAKRSMPKFSRGLGTAKPNCHRGTFLIRFDNPPTQCRDNVQ